MTEVTQTKFFGDTSQLETVVNLLQRLDPAFYKQETEAIYRDCWLPVASVTDLPEPNTFVVAQVPPLRTSLVVTRDGEGKVHAFHNICRHRGARLVRKDGGCKKAIACGFHGWTYATDGRLIGVTDKTQFEDMDPSKLGLIEVHVEVWEDYVFVNFAETPTVSLADWLGKFYDQYPGFFSDRERIASYKIEVAANWNVAINSFSEGYHALYVHRKTVPDYQGGKENPLRHRTYLEITDYHGRYSAQANPNRRVTPVEELAFKDGLPMYPGFPPFSEEGLPLPPGVNASRNPYWGFDVVEIFPCMIILIGAYWHANLWFWPIDADRSDLRVDFFTYKAKTVGDRLAQAYFRTRLREVYREDVGMMEHITEVMKSGAMRDIVLSKQELLVQQHYTVANKIVGAAATS